MTPKRIWRMNLRGTQAVLVFYLLGFLMGIAFTVALLSLLRL